MGGKEEKKITILSNSRKNMRTMFAWPFEHEEQNLTRLFFWRFAFIMMTTMPLFLGSFLHMVHTLGWHTGGDIREDVGQTVSYIGIGMFIIFHVESVREAVDLYSELSDLKTYGKPPKFDETSKKFNFIAYVFNLYNTILILGIALGPILNTNECYRLNEELGLNELCGLQTHVWLPFDVDYFPAKQLFYAVQVYGSLMTQRTAAYVSFFIWEAVQYIRLRFNHVKALFREAIEEKDPEIGIKKFGKVIDYHNVVIDYALRFNDLYKISTFVHVLFTGVVIGFTGYQSVENASLGNLLLLVGWFSSACFACFGGQIFMDDSLSVGDDIYETNWYDAHPRIQHAMKMVMMRCMKPIYLKAGPISYLNYALIITILKTSYSYLALVRQTNSQN